MFLRCLLACTGSDRSTGLIEVISRRVVNGRKEKVERWFDYLFDFILTPAHSQSLQTPPTDYENDSNTREVPRHHPLSLPSLRSGHFLLLVYNSLSPLKTLS